MLAAHAAGWSASLRLEFAERAQRTTLVRREHRGPLQVQRPFHPETDGTCHAYLLHPPGGVVGGDALEITIDAQPGARCLITTPASGKFYRSGGATARQTVTLRVRDGATLEWLPQETLYFDGARVDSSIHIELDADANFIGWDIACLGRPASGERYTRGAIRQRIALRRDGRPLLLEHAAYDANAPVMQAAWGLAGQCVTGTLVCTTRDDAPALEPLREQCVPLAHDGAFAASQLRSVLVCRYLGPHTHEARACLERAWEMLRPTTLGKPACAPRIWST
jgi:urease accessory protein